MNRSRTYIRALARSWQRPLQLSACSLGGSEDDETSQPTTADDTEGAATSDAAGTAEPDDSEQTSEVAAPPSDPGTVLLVTHDSFNGLYDLEGLPVSGWWSLR